MATDKDTETTLLAIHSRLGIVEGKVALIARAERDRLLPILEAEVRKSPLIGQIYLLLHRALTQNEIKDELAKHRVDTSQPTISRRLERMETELGMIELAGPERGGNTYRRNRVMEETFNLSKRVEGWLEDEGEPAPKVRRRRGGRRTR